MKKYIRICHCCGNTFETDMMTNCCKSCSDKMEMDFRFYKMEYPTSKEEAFNY